MTIATGRSRLADERAEARRGDILEAAAAVFARRGYHQARTREIAEEAGISEGSIYNYFASKRDLLLAIMDRIVTESIPQVYTTPESHDLHGLALAFIHDRLEMLDRNQQLLKAVVPEIINDEELREGYLQQVTFHLVGSLTPLAQQALATGELRPFDARVLLPAIAGAVITAFVFNEMVDFPMGEPVSREELADELLGIFLDGLRKRDETNASQP